jgi:hypothetical protein
MRGYALAWESYVVLHAFFFALLVTVVRFGPFSGPSWTAISRMIV